jgi:acetolactate synthase-1/2/3 large subunit
MPAGSPDHPAHARSTDNANASGAPPGMTGAQGVAQVISRLQNPVVYGIPGGYTVQIFDALYFLKDRVQTRLVREEAFATVMAEAHGRLTGQPAVVMGQGAWVLGNAGIGIMEAHLGASPMIILVDATDGGAFAHLGPYQAGLGGYGAYDLAAALRAITKQTFVALDPTQAVQMTQLAIKHATTGEPGPVAVVFHGRALFERVDPAVQPPIHLDKPIAGPAKTVATDEQIKQAASLIRGARKPVLLIGNGVRLAKAEKALAAFADRLGIPVATTPAGKGTFAETHALAVGVMGAFGHEVANATVGEADLLIAVGTKLGASDTANQHPRLIDKQRAQLIHIDVEPLNIGWTLPVDCAVTGDACDALERLEKACANMTFEGITRVLAHRQSLGYFNRELTSQAGNFSGRDAVAILAQELPEGSIATCDAGENRLYMLRDFQTKPHGTVLQPNGGGGMGYAVPAAVSASLCREPAAAVAVCGDGGMSMTLHALMTAIELNAKVLVVVLDNQILGWVYNGQRNRLIASELKPFDFAAIAQAMGCHGQQTDDPLVFRQAVREALLRPGVSVIVAKTSQADRYQDVMSSLHAHDVYAVPEHP